MFVKFFVTFSSSETTWISKGKNLVPAKGKLGVKPRFIQRESLMMRKRYSGDFKAKVLQELLKGKRTLNELSDHYGLHPNQIKNWKTVLFKRAHIILEDKRCTEKDSHPYI